MKIKKFLICAIVWGYCLCLAQTSFAAQKILLAVYKDTHDYQITRQAFQSGLDQAAKQEGLDIEWVELNQVGVKEETFVSSLKQIENSIDMIFVAGTPNALAVKKAGIKKPVLFAAVANPKKAKLVHTLHHPGTNFTGTYCAVSANRQLQTILKFLPSRKNIAIIYNPFDPSPAAQVAEWEKVILFLEDSNINLTKIRIPEQVQSVQGMTAFMNKLNKKIDILITTADFKISQYGEGIIQVANQSKIPVYSSLNYLVEKGALLSVGFKFKQAVENISVAQGIKILKGVLPTDIPVGTLPEYSLAINLKTAKQVGIELPEKMIQAADIIIQ